MPTSSTNRSAKPWSAAKASTWLKNYADELGKDALQHKEEWMWACAGATYYAVIHGVGYNSRQEFIDYLSTHLNVDADSMLIQDALEEIEGP
jgi:hypothetical protein